MKKQSTLTVSRRGFIGGAAAVAASTVMPQYVLGSTGGQKTHKPNSKFNGVQIGAITYSFRSMTGTAEDILRYVIRCGLSSVELMGGPAEQFAGLPTGRARTGARRGKTADRQQGKQLNWRLSASMDRFKAFRTDLLVNKAAEKLYPTWQKNLDQWKLTGSDRPYHYYGSAIWYTRIGHAAGQEMLELMKN